MYPTQFIHVLLLKIQREIHSYPKWDCCNSWHVRISGVWGNTLHKAIKLLSTEAVLQLYSRTGDSGELQQAGFVGGTKLKTKGEFLTQGSINTKFECVAEKGKRVLHKLHSASEKGQYALKVDTQ